VARSAEELRAAREWRPIPNCPGRFVLAGGPQDQSPSQLAGEDLDIREFRVPTARDPVMVVRFEDGGIISYRRPDGRFVHTLNTPEGFDRKLHQLGIRLDG
jgi:phage baseplate assembly protein gpV